MKNYEMPEIVELGTADALVLGISDFGPDDNPEDGEKQRP
jgi:hypothetical protein